MARGTPSSPPVEVRIESLAFGGDGVGRLPDGRVAFVPLAVPGDRLAVAIVEEHRTFVRAELARVISPSPDRVTPPCPLFVGPGCGGCQWQQASGAAQRAAKLSIVRAALRRAGSERVGELAAPAPDTRWRRRARLRWRRRADGEGRGVDVGYAARRSHRLVDVPACSQLEAALEAALARLRAALAAAPPAALEGTVQLLLGGRGEVHVAIGGRGVAALGSMAESLLAAPGPPEGRIVGIGLEDERGGAPVVHGAATVDLADDAAPFLAAAGVFAQVSAAGNAALRHLVREAAAPLEGARVLELFAGSGNFTRDLAAAGAAAITAVEDHEVAARLGAANLAARGLAARVAWRAEAAEVAVPALRGAAGEGFDRIVLDPPRTGLARGLAPAIAALGAARIVYVSCDPQTLARDVEALGRAGGYRLVAATPVDLMPQTYHIEVVARLER